jgi:hypothetical protein
MAAPFLRYTPPKSRLHGHSCNRLSASDLLGKANRFLTEHTRLDDRHGERSVTVTWRSSASDRVATILHQLSGVVGDPSEKLERSELGAACYKAQWNVSEDQLPMVVAWLDKHELDLERLHAGVVALRIVGFWWLPRHRRHQNEFPEPLIFGVVLSRPRAIMVPFLFYDVLHYREIKRYLEGIGLASLSDGHISPKAALLSGGTAGAK